MRVYLNFCEQSRGLLFDLGTIMIFRQVSGGVDIMADGDKRDDIKIAQDVFISAYKRRCEEDEIAEDLSDKELKKAFKGFKMFHLTKIMAAFHTIMDMDTDPDEPAQVTLTDENIKK